MTDTRTHSCGRQMTATRFDHHNPTPQYRDQPIWLCRDGWEPREGWDGPLPADWDGQKWTNQ
jgi:hypothetical protein